MTSLTSSFVREMSLDRRFAPKFVPKLTLLRPNGTAAFVCFPSRFDLVSFVGFLFCLCVTFDSFLINHRSTAARHFSANHTVFFSHPLLFLQSNRLFTSIFLVFVQVFRIIPTIFSSSLHPSILLLRSSPPFFFFFLFVLSIDFQVSRASCSSNRGRNRILELVLCSRFDSARSNVTNSPYKFASSSSFPYLHKVILPAIEPSFFFFLN